MTKEPQQPELDTTKTADGLERLYTVKELSKIVGVPDSTIRLLCENRKLRCVSLAINGRYAKRRWIKAAWWNDYIEHYSEHPNHDPPQMTDEEHEEIETIRRRLAEHLGSDLLVSGRIRPQTRARS